jgi:hypothetical protein
MTIGLPNGTNKNAASFWLSGVLCLSDWLGHRIMPRAPSLELSVLRNGGGQKPDWR